MSHFKTIGDYSHFDDVDIDKSNEIELQLGMCRLFCPCGTQTEYAISTGIQFVRGRSACYVLCEECKDKMTEEEFKKKLTLSIYKTGKIWNYIPVPITFLFGEQEFLIPRTDGSITVARAANEELKNRVRLSSSLDGYVMYVIWPDPSTEHEFLGKDVSIDKVLELNSDNPSIVDAIQKLKKYYPSS